MQVRRELDRITAERVAERFGLGIVEGVGEYVARGVSGEIFRLDTSAGRWALKRMLAAPDPEQIETAVRLQDAARAAGVRSPRTIRASGGAVLAAVDDQLWQVSEWVEADADAPDLFAPDRLRALGEALARIHSLRLSPPHDVVPWLTTAPTADAWARLCADVQESDVTWAAEFLALRPELRRLSELVASTPPSGAVLSHCDLGPANVAVAGGRLLVLDWERAGAIPPMQELGYVLVQWCRPLDRRPLAGHIVSGYREGLPNPGLDVFAVAACAWLNFLSAMANAAVSGRAAFATSQVTAMIDDPLTTGELEQLLRAAF